MLKNSNNMISHQILLIIHLISASIWVGGHLYLCICLVPKALFEKSPEHILNFEKTYERLGIPSLLLLVVSGIWMTLQFGIGIEQWFSFSSPIERITSLKLLLLLSTVVLAIIAQTVLIPRLKKDYKLLPAMSVFIFLVTLIGVSMMILGSFVRYGGIR